MRKARKVLLLGGPHHGHTATLPWNASFMELPVGEVHEGTVRYTVGKMVYRDGDLIHVGWGATSPDHDRSLMGWDDLELVRAHMIEHSTDISSALSARTPMDPVHVHEAER